MRIGIINAEVYFLTSYNLNKLHPLCGFPNPFLILVPTTLSCFPSNYTQWSTERKPKREQQETEWVTVWWTVEG